MAIVMRMHWPEVSKDQYEAVRKDVNWEGVVPDGAKLHVSWFGSDGFHVFDLWDSISDFEKFVKERLTPATQKAGIQGQPQVEFDEAYAVFAPNP